MLGASKRGTQSQPIPPSGATSAPVWQLDRNAYSAIGGNGEGAAALCGSLPDAGLAAFTFAVGGGFVALMTPPTGRANGRGPRPARWPLSAPTIRACTDARAAASRSAAA